MQIQGTQKTRIRIRGLKKCGSNADPDQNPELKTIYFVNVDDQVFYFFIRYYRKQRAQQSALTLQPPNNMHEDIGKARNLSVSYVEIDLMFSKILVDFYSYYTYYFFYYFPRICI